MQADAVSGASDHFPASIAPKPSLRKNWWSGVE